MTSHIQLELGEILTHKQTVTTQSSEEDNIFHCLSWYKDVTEVFNEINHSSELTEYMKYTACTVPANKEYDAGTPFHFI